MKTKEGRRKYFFVKGLVMIVDAIIPVMSLGHFASDLTFKFNRWAFMRAGWND